MCVSGTQINQAYHSLKTIFRGIYNHSLTFVQKRLVLFCFWFSHGQRLTTPRAPLLVFHSWKEKEHSHHRR
jgi:hypothetical protein